MLFFNQFVIATKRLLFQERVPFRWHEVTTCFVTEHYEDELIQYLKILAVVSSRMDPLLPL